MMAITARIRGFSFCCRVKELALRLDSLHASQQASQLVFERICIHRKHRFPKKIPFFGRDVVELDLIELGIEIIHNLVFFSGVYLRANLSES